MALAQGALPEGAGPNVGVDSVSQPPTGMTPGPVAQTQVPYAFVDSDSQSNDESNASESVTSSPEATHSEIGQLRAELAALKSQLDQLKTDGSSVDPELNPDEIEESTQLSQVVDHFDRRIGQVLELIETPTKKAQDQNPLIGGLVSTGISKSHAEDLVARVSRIVPDGTPHDGDVLSSLQQMIADDLMTGGRIDVQDTHRRVMAFVGPTGVGKTTTVAKVASTARLAGKRVGSHYRRHMSRCSCRTARGVCGRSRCAPQGCQGPEEPSNGAR